MALSDVPRAATLFPRSFRAATSNAIGGAECAELDITQGTIRHHVAAWARNTISMLEPQPLEADSKARCHCPILREISTTYSVASDPMSRLASHYPEWLETVDFRPSLIKTQRKAADSLSNLV